MKKTFFILILCCGVISYSNAADKRKTPAKITPGQKRAEATASLKNTEITVENFKFDYRVLKYYDEATLRTLPLAKLKQIDFLYNNSFTVKDLGNCGLSLKDIDIASLEVYRKDNVSTVVEFGKQCKVHVELISRELLNQTMKELAK